MKNTIARNLSLVFWVLFFLTMAACSSSAWHNPHGLLAGLFDNSSHSSDSSRARHQSDSGPPTTSTIPPERKGGGFISIPPPKFIHIVPFSEGDGFYLQWTKVPQATDYLLYREGSLVADVPHNLYRIHGLIPCRSYRFSIWSSNGSVISKKPLIIDARTLGCFRTR
ncbi:MAG: hypothetical protein ACYCTV_05685 [Leptospirales bacterium]